MTSKRRALMLMIGVLSPRWGVASPEVLGADIVAQGSASQAASRSNAAVTTNPGLLALHRRYDFSAQFGYGPNRGLHWAVGGMDAKTLSHFALGFVYSGDRYEPELRVSELPGWNVPGEEIPNKKRTHDFATGVATSFFEDRLSLGLGGHLTLYDHDRQGKGTTGNVDVGLGLRPIDLLTVGVSGNNLVPFDPLDDRPLRVAGGVRVDGKAGAIEVDGGWVHVEAPTPATFAGGFELRPKTGRIRGGFQYDGPTLQTTITAGLGVESEGGALEYAIQIPLGTDLGSTVHVIGVRFSAPPGLDPDSGNPLRD